MYAHIYEHVEVCLYVIACGVQLYLGQFACRRVMCRCDVFKTVCWRPTELGDLNVCMRVYMYLSIYMFSAILEFDLSSLSMETLNTLYEQVSGICIHLSHVGWNFDCLEKISLRCDLKIDTTHTLQDVQ